MDLKDRTAPTFLYNSGNRKELFRTQEEVDAAIDDGWYSSKGPETELDAEGSVLRPGMTMKEIKQVAREAYGLIINKNKTKAAAIAEIKKWEMALQHMDQDDSEGD